METLQCIVAAAVNDDIVLQNNLLASPMIAELKVPVEVRSGFECAGHALNSVLNAIKQEQVAICAHQDVYFPKGWENFLLENISILDKKNEPWSVLGVYGITVNSLRCGRAWSVGLGREVRGDCPAPAEAISLDEIVLIVKGGTGIRFDDNLPGFHLYGTDIVQNAKSLGYKAFIIDAPVVHNSMPVKKLGKDYWRSYMYCRRKWRDRLPISTTVVPLSRFAGALIRHNISSLTRRFIGGKKKENTRVDNPDQTAIAAGYSNFHKV